MTPRDLSQLYDEHAQALFAFVLNLTRHEADTRDVLQELFLKLAKRPSLLEGITEPRAFLIRLAHNLAIDTIRRRVARERRHERQAEAAETLFIPADTADEDVFRRALSVALGDLPADQRAVIHLKLWEAMTFEAIAEALDIPPNTAASRYRYGIDKLRAQLRPYYEEIKNHG